MANEAISSNTISFTRDNEKASASLIIDRKGRCIGIEKIRRENIKINIIAGCNRIVSHELMREANFSVSGFAFAPPIAILTVVLNRLSTLLIFDDDHAKDFIPINVDEKSVNTNRNYGLIINYDSAFKFAAKFESHFCNRFVNFSFNFHPD